MGLAALALGVVIAGGLGVAAWRTHGPAYASASDDTGAAVGGPFSLTDANGRPVDQRVLAGKWSAVFFGYTNCPDSCPATLQALNAAGQLLGPARKDFQVVFVSVDPARDTPAQMKLYASAQGYPAGGLVALTGTPAQVASVAKAYHVFYAKGDGSGANYAVQHSAAIYLMDPKGRFSKPLIDSMPPKALADQIAAAMRS